jgi:hypothetical protein
MLAKPLRFVPLVLAMFGLAVAPSISRAQNQMELFRIGEQTAFASFTAPVAGDVTGCLITSVEVRVFDDTRAMRKEGPGKPFIGLLPGAGLSIFEFNTCISQITEYYECGSLDATGFNVSPSLDSAMFDTTLSCIDETNFELPPFEITVDITWEGTGPVTRLFRHERQTGSVERTHALIRVARREAVATGSILLNGVNLIPDESENATLAAERRMTHSVLK